VRELRYVYRISIAKLCGTAKRKSELADRTETGCTSADRIQLYDRVAGSCERGKGNGSYCAVKGAKLHGQLDD